ncbi:hypothetical protein ACHAXT_001529 [Thalassiosira profunda]
MAAAAFARLACCFLLAIVVLVGVDAAPSPTPPTVPASPRRPSGAAFYPEGRDRPHHYRIASEVVHYSGWRKVIRRSVVRHHHRHDDEDDVTTQRQEQTVIDFDVIDQTHSTSGAVIIFAWNSTSKTATIVREYMPGPHRLLSGLAAGIVEDDKHSGEKGAGNGESKSLVAARCELEEECHLAGGKWYQLTEEGVSVPMDKYVVTEITPYLVIDPQHVPDPRPLDAEEDIEIVTGVSEGAILRMIREGDFTLVGGWGALLALEKLREIGQLP